VVAADATVIRLHDLLQRAFKACRTNHTLAALKLHTVISVLGRGPRSVKTPSGRTSSSARSLSCRAKASPRMKHTHTAGTVIRGQDFARLSARERPSGVARRRRDR
jgi:hypothetical protein